MPPCTETQLLSELLGVSQQPNGEGLIDSQFESSVKPPALTPFGQVSDAGPPPRPVIGCFGSDSFISVAIVVRAINYVA